MIVPPACGALVAVSDPYLANRVDGKVSLHAFTASIASPLFVRDLFWREDTRIAGDNKQAVYVAMQLLRLEAARHVRRSGLMSCQPSAPQ